MRENESMWVSTHLPQLCGMLPRSPTYFLLHPGYWGVLIDNRWGVRSGWEHSSQGSQKMSKEPDPAVSWTSSGSLPISYWWCFSCICPQVALRYLQCSMYLTHISSYHVADSRCMPLGQWLQAFADSWGACTESWPISMGLEESTQIWAFSTAVRKAREVWSSFLESREGMQF